ncbi:hypothetical protein N5923_12270 [Erwiniaceae bacterium BAC15a-03b]|uniref:Uncharacterized protein n=1 Tax=Winslowiella arboricola TaxID=2978220 RepID=A0A9J6PPF3_9GAMM|nr:hypothetical protein [Winslowiella arboricola]MCU5772717.1 hypothetical protein [Winslowiella arboricola]MCU5778267.1 hypothetical protein [Winslowiella arboricola]
MINRHQFITRGRLTISLTLLVVLIAPTLVTIAITRQQHQQLTQVLTQEMKLLQAHRQAAEAISVKQRAFDKAPQQLESSQLNGLALIAPALHDDIALLSLEKDARQQRMRIEVLSRSLDALLDFVSRLQRLPARVGLESHQTETTMPETWKIRATLNLEYADAP